MFRCLNLFVFSNELCYSKILPCLERYYGNLSRMALQIKTVIASVFLDLTSISVSSFIICSHRPFLCLFGHSNRLIATLAETGKNSTPRHTQGSWRASLLCRLWFFRESHCRHPGQNTANAAGFHQWAIGSVTIVLLHSAIDSDLTDIYLNDNLISLSSVSVCVA